MKKQFTVIYTLYLENREYLENFLLSLSYFKKLNCPIIVVEQKAKYSAIQDLKLLNFDGTFIQFEGKEGIYQRTLGINKGLDKTNTKYSVVCDADVVVKKSQIIKTIEHLEETHGVLAYPYSHSLEIEKPINLTDLETKFEKLKSTNSESSDWLNEYCLDQILNSYLKPMSSISFNNSETYRNMGLIYVVNKQKYLECGGENPFFLDWGFEDHERYERISKLDKTPQFINGQCFHFKHERRHREAKFKLNNFFEWRKIKEMDSVELNDYVNSWIDQRAIQNEL